MTQQAIDFDHCDETMPSLIHSRDVILYPSSGTRDVDSKTSNKITAQNVVDYSWEDRYTIGQLVSYHAHMKLVAYVLSISNSFMIRILNEENSSRCLIKDFSAEVTDISFSRGRSPYIASIDVNGSVKVNKVFIGENMLECRLVVHIMANPSQSPVLSKVCYSRVLWCCGNINEAANPDISLLLGIAHGNTFEVLQVDTIETELSSKIESCDQKLDRPNLRLISKSFQDQYSNDPCLSDLFLPYLCHSAPGNNSSITSFAISNDAAAFAVAFQDGNVIFFTLDGSSVSGLKKAYSWRPFDQDAVWSLHFLDDCRSDHGTDSFWCHVVVGGAFNRQLKMFRCDKWRCLQTVTFEAPTFPCLLSAQLDLTARFLMMSDIYRKVLYLLEIDSVDGGATKLFKSVQEFILAQPLLSFDFNSIVCTPMPDGGQQIVVKLFTITSSAFQKMRVTYGSQKHRLLEIPVEDGDVDCTKEEEDCVKDDNEGVNTDENCVNEDGGYAGEDGDYDEENGDYGEEGLWGKLDKMDEEDARTDEKYHYHKVDKWAQYRSVDDESLDDRPVENAVSPRNALVLSTIPPATNVNFASSRSSVNSGFQDPAIISTTMLHPSLNNVPMEVPEALQHLFASVSTLHSGVHGHSGESEYEIPPKDTSDQSCQERGVQEEVQDRLPHHPCTANENRRSVVMSLDNDGEVARRYERRNEGLERLLSRMAKMLETQTSALGLLAHGVSKMREDVDCDCAEERQTRAGCELEGCEKALSLQMESCTREAMDAVVPRIIKEIGDKLREDVSTSMSPVKPVMYEFADTLLRDKTFVGSLAGAVAQSMEASLSDAYRDIGRKDLVSVLQRSMDRLASERRDSFRAGMQRVVAAVQRNTDCATKGLEEKLATLCSGQQKAVVVTIEEQSRELLRGVAGVRAALSEATKECSQQMLKMGDSLQAVRAATGECATVRGSAADLSNGHLAASRELHIGRLIGAGDFVGALDQALSLTHLPTLISTCSRVRPKSVLSSNGQKVSPLSSSSILALIQQLSRDFGVHSDLKIEYLFDALLSLDTEDLSIRDHVSKVLKGVARRLQGHLDHDCEPKNKERIYFLLRLTTSRFDSPE